MNSRRSIRAKRGQASARVSVLNVDGAIQKIKELPFLNVQAQFSNFVDAQRGVKSFYRNVQRSRKTKFPKKMWDSINDELSFAEDLLQEESERCYAFNHEPPGRALRQLEQQSRDSNFFQGAVEKQFGVQSKRFILSRLAGISIELHILQTRLKIIDLARAESGAKLFNEYLGAVDAKYKTLVAEGAKLQKQLFA